MISAPSADLRDVVDLLDLAGAGLVVRSARHHRNMGMLANPLLG